MFVGIDWAKESHDVCVVDKSGKIGAASAGDAHGRQLLVLPSKVVRQVFRVERSFLAAVTWPSGGGDRRPLRHSDRRSTARLTCF